MGGGKRYQALKLALFGAKLALSLSVLAFLAQPDPKAAIMDAIAGGGTALTWLLFSLVVFASLELAGLPLAFVSGFAVERRFGLATQTFGGWAADHAKAVGLSLPVFLLTSMFFYYSVELAGEAWWIICAAGYAAFGVFLTRVVPVWVVPLFYPMTPLGEGVLRDRLAALCERLGVRAPALYEIKLSRKTVKANAAVVGIGKSRRVVLGDTLVSSFPPEEVEMVIAHEIGHHALRHVPMGLAVSSAAGAAGFFLLHAFGVPFAALADARSLSDPAIVPALVLLSTAAAVLGIPAENAFSRRLEYAADAFALKAIPSITVFSSLMKRLVEKNLGDADPHPAVEFIFYSHPSAKNRLRRAERLLP